MVTTSSRKKPFYGHKLITTLTLLSLIVGFVLVCVDDTLLATVPKIAFNFMLFWLTVAICFVVFSYKQFVSGFLLTAFSMMVAWRIAAIYSIESITVPFVAIFILLLANFIYCIRENLKYPQKFIHPVSLAVWQLIFIRIYIGLDFIPHFTEKLFAGDTPRFADVQAFLQLGVPHSEFFVYLAGFCEFGAAIALCLGFMLRLGCVGAALYLAIATYLGHHFMEGFIWAGPGGGWEFAVMWTILILSYAVTGENEFSIDQVLMDKFKLSVFIKKLM